MYVDLEDRPVRLAETGTGLVPEPTVCAQDVVLLNDVAPLTVMPQ